MKKLLLSALAVCAFTFANAQEEKTTEATQANLAKGDIMMSGTVGFGTTSNVGGIKDDSASGYNFSPSATYLVSDNIGVGVKVGYGSGKFEDANKDEFKSTDLTLGAFGRYFITPASKFSVFGELGFDYVTSKSEFTTAGVTVDNPDNDGFDVAVGPGICYFVSSNFAIEANWGALGYSTRKDDFSGAESENTFGFNLDLSDINFGLAYKF